MKVSPTSSTPPGQIGASTASSSDSSPYTDYMNNGSQRAGSSSNRLGVSSTNPTSNQTIKPSGSGTSASTLSGLPQTTDHIQRLTQMTHDMGLVSSADSSTSNSVITAGLSATDPLYPTAAAAYIQQQYNWQHAYYQQLGQPMGPNSAFPGWPHYPPGWQNYAQTKKGRQTYQRYQTSVLESKFQQSSYVSKKQREELRLQTNLTDRQIKIWFQNRRMKAKKEKNRNEDPSDHSTLLPSNNAAKSLNSSLSSLNGAGTVGNNDGMMSSANLGMIGNQHLLSENTLQGLMMDQDESKQLKLASLHNGMMPNATTSPMWPPGMHSTATGVLNPDQINAWPQFMTQGAHQNTQYSYMPYSTICPPNI